VTWAFIWMMFVLKIPIAGLFWIVWRAIHAVPEQPAPETSAGGGGEGPHPRPHRPRPPRRGDHGVSVPQAPERVRAIAVESTERPLR
jgi:hypothetical protein